MRHYQCMRAAGWRRVTGAYHDDFNRRELASIQSPEGASKVNIYEADDDAYRHRKRPVAGGSTLHLKPDDIRHKTKVKCERDEFWHQ